MNPDNKDFYDNINIKLFNETIEIFKNTYTLIPKETQSFKDAISNVTRLAYEYTLIYGTIDHDIVISAIHYGRWSFHANEFILQSNIK